MQPFKEYLIEYVDRDNAEHKGIADIKSGRNGKSWNRVNSRKNLNTIPKGDSHKSPIVNKIVSGKISSTALAGNVLLNVLAEYGVEYEEGATKTLGNSNVAVSMFVDSNGNKSGVLKRKNG